MVRASANIPCVSIEANMGIFTGKNNSYSILQGIRALVKNTGFPPKIF